jgi:hypothetical protein
VLVTRADNGSDTFNSSSLLGLLFVDGLTNAYYPRPERGFGDTMSRFGGGVLSNAETNLLREFMPDMLRIFHRHEPEKLKKLEELEKKVPLADKLSPPKSPIVQPSAPADKTGNGASGGPATSPPGGPSSSKR